MTLYVSIGEPPAPMMGDVWFDPTTILTHEFVGPAPPGVKPWSWSGGPWRQIPPATSVPSNPKRGEVYVDILTGIPYYYDGQQWIGAVPPNYTFPPKNPTVGAIWIEPLSMMPYVFLGTHWAPTVGQPGSNTFLQGNGSFAAPPPQPNLNVTTNSSQPVMTISPAYLLQIYTQSGDIMVTIKNDGTMVYGPNYKPDAAAVAFWTAIAQTNPELMQSQIDGLVTDLKAATSRVLIAEDKIRKFEALGYKLPEPAKPIDPNDAWDRAFGVVK